MSAVTSLGLVRGVITAVLFGAFIALWIWAYSARRRADFAAAAALALDDGSSPPQHAANSEEQ